MKTSGGGCGAVAVAIVVVVIAAVALVVVGLAAGGDEGTSTNGSTTPFGAGGNDPKALLSPAGTQAVLAKLKRKMRPGERITSLSIRDEYLSAQTSAGDGQPERSLTFRSDGDDYDSTSTVTSRARGIALEAVDLRGPERLLAATRRGLGPRSRAKVSYVVLDIPTVAGDPSGWAVYLDGTSSDDSRWTSDIHGERVLRPADGAPAPPVGQPGPAKTPAGVTGTSMVRPGNLARAIAAVRKELPPSSFVTSVDVRPARIGITVRRSFRERVYTVDAAFRVEVGQARETSSKDGVPISQINARGPERALRKIDARQGNRAPERVDYVILSPRTRVFPQSRTVWLVYLKGGHPNGRYWRATADGRRIGRAGEPGAP